MNYIQSLIILALLLVAYCSSEGIAADQIAIACPAGWVSTNGKFPGCQACPLGTYQNKPSRKACKKCPSNTSTNQTGAVNKEQCVTVIVGNEEGKPCEPGSYSSTGHRPCTPCSIGYYSISTTTCKKCPLKRTTLSVGATHRRNCTKAKLLVPCPQGSTSPSGYLPCTKCPIGYYQPYEGQQVCAKCPKGFANEAEGAINCTNITTAVKQQQQQQQEDDNNKTIATCTEVKYQKLKGVRIKRIKRESGFFSSAKFPKGYKSGTKQQWRVHCLHDEYVAIIITHMDLPEGDYLQVEDDRCSGKLTHPTSRLIAQDSARVIFSGGHGNSSHGFQCAFICIDQDKRVWTESFLYNEEIMELIKVVIVHCV